jgi:hypothetical protein
LHPDGAAFMEKRMPEEQYLADEGLAMTEMERHLSSPSSFSGWNVFGETSA